MHIAINYCGTHSLTGAIAYEIYDIGKIPHDVIFDIHTVMQGTDVEKELKKSQKAFSHLGINMSLGVINRDLHKEELAVNPNAICFS